MCFDYYHKFNFCQYTQEDSNYDGIIDKCDFKFKMNLNSLNNINAVSLILLFDVQTYVS